MFTGLIETLGVIKTVNSSQKSVIITVKPSKKLENVKIGESISIDGACLTVESVSNHELSFTAVQESLKRTTLSKLSAGSMVNMERALKLGDRLDGHIVQGHVDDVGTISKLEMVGNSLLLSVKVPHILVRFLAEKGSVAVDGISLTIAESKNDVIIISLIPQTLSDTTIVKKRVGDKVNIECDLFARYIFQQLSSNSIENSDDRLMTLLEKNGF